MSALSSVVTQQAHVCCLGLPSLKLGESAGRSHAFALSGRMQDTPALPVATVTSHTNIKESQPTADVLAATRGLTATRTYNDNLLLGPCKWMGTADSFSAGDIKSAASFLPL
jgi:hypothetical protein